MALFKKKHKDEDKERITTEDLLMGMATSRATINPEYLKNDAKKCLEQLLQAYYSGNVGYLPYDKMTDEYYTKIRSELERDIKNGVTRNLYIFEVKNVRATNVDNSMMYMVSSVEFEIHYIVAYGATHSTFDEKKKCEIKARYEFVSGNTTQNKKGWLVNKESSKRMISNENFDPIEYQRQLYAQQQAEYQRQWMEYQQKQMQAQYINAYYGNQQNNPNMQNMNQSANYAQNYGYGYATQGYQQPNMQMQQNQQYYTQNNEQWNNMQQNYSNNEQMQNINQQSQETLLQNEETQDNTIVENAIVEKQKDTNEQSSQENQVENNIDTSANVDANVDVNTNTQEQNTSKDNEETQEEININKDNSVTNNDNTDTQDVLEEKDSDIQVEAENTQVPQDVENVTTNIENVEIQTTNNGENQ